jgi:carbonic anhydrase/acetyltransferase-like protein (isoleucine patch superfamily)
VDAGVPARIGNRVTVGHGAIIHGATVEDGALIGIGAIVLNGAKVSEGAVVGAGALVPEGMEIPPRTLAVGVPARVIKEVSPELAARTKENAEHYVLYGRLYREENK